MVPYDSLRLYGNRSTRWLPVINAGSRRQSQAVADSRWQSLAVAGYVTVVWKPGFINQFFIFDIKFHLKFTDMLLRYSKIQLISAYLFFGASHISLFIWFLHGARNFNNIKIWALGRHWSTLTHRSFSKSFGNIGYVMGCIVMMKQLFFHLHQTFFSRLDMGIFVGYWYILSYLSFPRILLTGKRFNVQCNSTAWLILNVKK